MRKLINLIRVKATKEFDKLYLQLEKLVREKLRKGRFIQLAIFLLSNLNF